MTVGVALQMLMERAGWIGRLVLGLVGTAWNIAMFFTVPVLVVEGVGPIAAVKRSFEVMRETWGESQVTQVGVGAVMGLLTMATLFVSIAAGIALSVVTNSPWPAVAIIGLGLVATVLVALAGSTLKMILVAACYRMATTGLVPEGFEGGTLRGMFGKKQ